MLRFSGWSQLALPGAMSEHRLFNGRFPTQVASPRRIDSPSIDEQPGRLLGGRRRVHLAAKSGNIGLRHGERTDVRHNAFIAIAAADGEGQGETYNVRRALQNISHPGQAGASSQDMVQPS